MQGSFRHTNEYTQNLVETISATHSVDRKKDRDREKRKKAVNNKLKKRFINTKNKLFKNTHKVEDSPVKETSSNRDYNTLRRVMKIRKYRLKGKYVYVRYRNKMMLTYKLQLKPLDLIPRYLNPISEIRLTDFVFPMDSSVLSDNPNDKK